MSWARVRTAIALAVPAAALVAALSYAWIWPRWVEHRTVKPLIHGLGHHDVVVRVRAAKSLGKIGPRARTAIPRLIECLEDENFNVRWRAADALGAMGPLAQQAVPALIKAAHDEDQFASWAAADALLKIDSAAAEQIGARRIGLR